MPNGKIGDNPFTDIIVHGRDVYSQRAAELVRAINALADDKTRRDLAAGARNIVAPAVHRWDSCRAAQRGR